MANRAPTYKTYVDWHGHGGLTLGLDNWDAVGSLSGGLTEDASQAYHGDTSLRTSWDAITDGAFKQRVGRSYTEPKATAYTLSVWVMVPAGSPDVEVAARTSDGGSALVSSVVTVKGAWSRIDLELSTTAGASWVTAHPATDEAGTAYVGWLRLTSPLDDISADVLMNRTVPSIVYGRDSARDLSEIRTGAVGLELHNKSQKYTPDNPGSPLADLLRPNRQVLMTAEHDSRLYTLYIGYSDDYVLDAGLNAQSVYMSCSDLLARLNTIEIHTRLFPSIRTGGAVFQILSTAGISTFDSALVNQIDSGATVLRWWSASGVTALQALNDIVKAEGPPSLYTVGINGKLIFRDRLHRQRAAYPTVATTRLVGNDAPGAFALRDGSAVDYGWSSVGNSVQVRYARKEVSGKYSTVWSQSGDTSWGDENVLSGNRTTFTGTVSTGYFDAQSPVQGRLTFTENVGPEETNVVSGVEPDDADYVLVNGNVSVYSRTLSGTRMEVSFRDLTTGAGSTSTIRDMSIRAKAVVSEEAVITKDDAISAAEYGSVKTLDLNLGPVTQADAEAIATLVLRKRSLRRPTISAVLQNSDSGYTAMQLRQDLSGLVRVSVPQWHIDADFSIEGIQHVLGEEGKNHRTVLHLEQVSPVTLGAPFTFDVEGQGFGDGVFSTGTMNATNVFILGSSMLNSTDLLTY